MNNPIKNIVLTGNLVVLQYIHRNNKRVGLESTTSTLQPESTMTHRQALETLLKQLERKLWLARTSGRDTSKQQALLVKQIEAINLCL